MAFRETREFDEGIVSFTNGTEVRFSAPVRGVALQHTPMPGRLLIERTPAEQGLPHELQLALDEHEAIEEESLQIELSETPDGDAVDIGAANAIPGGFARVILYRDESGGMSWHFADDFLPLGKMAVPWPLRLSSGGEVVRPARPHQFRIPLRTLAARAAVEAHRASFGERSLFTNLGRKIFRIFLLPIAARVLGDPLRDLVQMWERRYRPEMLRTLTPESLHVPPEPFTDFGHLASGRALLVVHGIFSSTKGMLSRLAPSQMQKLQDLYGKRVIAFDHFTLSRSPEENARWLIDELAKSGRRFQFDILCHSRGGIIARTLRERAAELNAGRAATFHKIFFAATPNRGSALANADRILDMLDVFTNVGAALTGGAVAVSLELVMSVLKLIAYTGITEVPGIAAMAPADRGYIEGTLNARELVAPQDYSAVAANFEPDPARHNAFFTAADSVIDRVFGRDTENDLVVPTNGVFKGLGKQRIDIDRHVYRDRIWHTELFSESLTIERALVHFGAAEAVPVELRDAVLTGHEALESVEWTSRSFDGVDRIAMPELESPAPELPATIIERVPTIDFHEEVIPGVENDLVVHLDARTAQNLNRAVTTFLIEQGRESVDVTVQLFAPGFDVKPADVQKLIVGRAFDANRERVTYQLTARAVAHATRREITADFSVGGVSVGGVAHVTWAVPPGEQRGDDAPPFQPLFRPEAAIRERADVRIVVKDKGDGRKFSVSVTSVVPGFDVADLDLGELTTDEAGASGYIERFLGPTINARPDPAMIDPTDLADAVNTWKASLVAEVGQLGMKLWEWLPKDFQQFYFELHDANVAPRSIHVVSDDMLFPWELVVPWRNIRGRRDQLAPFGMAHIMGRWRPGLYNKPDPQRYPVTKIAVMNPDYPPPMALPASRTEAAALQQTFGAKCVVINPCDLVTVTRDVLGASDIQIVHFTGHADFDEVIADRSALLLLNGQQLTAAAFGSGAITATGPIVVLNACSVGMSGLTAGRAGGFAEESLKRGCSAVLAPYWPVTDTDARDFSLAFYDKLRGGRTFGEALEELRLDRRDDPTYQAYTFFGDPLARIVI